MKILIRNQYFVTLVRVHFFIADGRITIIEDNQNIIDLFKSENRDFFHIDLCAKNLFIPEADNSVSLIYCSHTLEHLSKKASKRFLKECFRILNNGSRELFTKNFNRFLLSFFI